MPRFIETNKSAKPLDIDDSTKSTLEGWLNSQITDAISNRKSLESMWRDCVDRYEGVPNEISRDIPIENGPNIRITLGAASCDTLYAQAVDLIFNTSPLLTVRSRTKAKDESADLVKDAKALQDLVNGLATLPDAGLREAAETAILYNIQFGTGFLYIPFVEKVKKTKTSKIQSVGPKFVAVAPENIIVPSGTRENLEEALFVGVQFFFDSNKLSQLAKSNKWNLTGFTPCQTPSWVREKQETTARQHEGIETSGWIYDVQYIFAYYDIDDDGIDEDLLIIYNHSSGKIGFVSYNPFDYRPVTVMNFQKRPHLIYGMGVLEMTGPYEDKLSDVANYATINILLSNCRVWAGDGSVPADLHLFPGRVITGLQNANSLVPLQMADVYPSIWQDMGMTTQYANQRIGLNGAITPSAIPDRASGVTTSSILQQVNRRFTPAFDSMRLAIGNALRQSLFRLQERVLAGDSRVEEFIFDLVGLDKGNRILDMFANPKFDEAYDIELTAASASINKEADRRDIMLLTQVMGQYQRGIMEMLSIASNPQTPPEVVEAAKKIVAVDGEMMERALRTFDSIRDPETFIIGVEKEMAGLQASGQATRDAMSALMQQMTGAPGLPEAPAGVALGERTMI